MAKMKDFQERIKGIADESLDTFAKIAAAAKTAFASSTQGGDPKSFASMNTFTSFKAVKNKEEINQTLIKGYRKLAEAPASARIVVVDGNKQPTTYYVCPDTISLKSDSKIKLASYRSPIGRLATLDIGDEFTLPRDQGVVEILESIKFRPIRESGEWDSRPSIHNDGTTRTVESLRALLAEDIERFEGDDATRADRRPDKKSAAENIRKGARRDPITKSDLRDQQILDKYQDEIFRLPLNSQLLILGAPGTGKTTTLIKRLGQKLDLGSLNESEAQIVNGLGNEIDYSRNWIMFTPTELLQLYVKEAFNRENISAPNERIKTWADFRSSVARNTFPILRSASGKSSWVMNETVQTLEPKTIMDQIDWFSDFDQWHRVEFSKEMRASAEELSKNSAPEVAQIGQKILDALGPVDAPVQPSVFVSLMKLLGEIREVTVKLKASSDKKITGAFNIQDNKDKGFRKKLMTFVAGLSDLSDDPEDADDPDSDIDEEEETVQPRAGRAAALSHYMRAVRTHARARARGRKVSKKSRAGQIIEWIGDRTLSEQELKETGKSLVVQSALRRFINPVRRYINRIPTQYRRFRRDRQKEKRWYSNKRFSPTDIHPLEVDLVLLAMIRSTDELIDKARALDGEDSPGRATLERLQHLYFTQVLVDEATDFSPIQLSCMATLARPGIRSFFACGDFNQRLTDWGTQSVKQMNWVVPKIKTRTITVAYRQSRQLHRLAKQITKLPGGTPNNAKLSNYVENDGVPPALATQMAGKTKVANWLAHRIKEIDKRRGISDFPSIAVLVNSEKEVEPVADALGNKLTNVNIPVVACKDGQALGKDNAVRVFNVKHIKGLEFEAVFFIGVDKLAKEKPSLFDKYLYVGATRAATYLGITCEKTLPRKIANLKKLFGETWE